jgi:hypothetical protein
MRFTVPQFIEKETPIVGPLTFKQFIFVAAGGAICFFLYFNLGKINFSLFLLISVFVMAISLALAFLQIGGRPLPTVLVNFLKFATTPKTYLWRKKEIPVKILRKESKESTAGIAEKTQLSKIKSSKGLY